MLLHHKEHKSKDVPDEHVEKFIANAWYKAKPMQPEAHNSEVKDDCVEIKIDKRSKEYRDSLIKKD